MASEVLYGGFKDGQRYIQMMCCKRRGIKLQKSFCLWLQQSQLLAFILTAWIDSHTHQYRRWLYPFMTLKTLGNASPRMLVTYSNF